MISEDSRICSAMRRFAFNRFQDGVKQREIYQLINDLASKDKGIIMISSEMPELIGVTDRILVMSNGQVAGIVNTKDTSQEEILTLAAKYL